MTRTTIALILALLLAPTILAQTLPFGTSVYTRIQTTGIADARAQAAAMGGHLVTINNAAEDAFLHQFLSSGNPYIGLSDEVTEGTFVWDSGEPVTYTNWNTGEPNDGGSGEDYGVLRSLDGRWNDANGTPGNGRPAIVEVPTVSCNFLVDQDYLGNSNSETGASLNVPAAQTFTVGMSGGTLGEVTVELEDILGMGATEDVTCRIHSTVGGMMQGDPTTNVLGQITRTLTATGLHTFDFCSQRISVSAGEVLGISLYSPNAASFAMNWKGRSAGNYPNGEGLRYSGGIWQAIGNPDYYFRTTIDVECPGTEHLDDVTQTISLNGIDATYPVMPNIGDLITISTTTPGGTLINQPLLVVAELHSSVTLPTSPFPGICVSGTTSTVLVNTGPFQDILTPAGHTYSFFSPTALAGTSMMSQALVLAPSPLADNGIFASSHGREIIFP